MGIEWGQVRAQFAALIDEAEKRGTTQVMIAKRAGVSQSSVSRTRQNTKGDSLGPCVMTLVKMIEATGYSVAAFFAHIEGPLVARPIGRQLPPPVDATALDREQAQRDRQIARHFRQLLRLSQAQTSPSPSSPRRRRRR
jgi:transcriptional regulator with XRE-family HTH domain